MLILTHPPPLNPPFGQPDFFAGGWGFAPRVSASRYGSVRVSTSPCEAVQVSTCQYESVRVSTIQHELARVSASQYKSVRASGAEHSSLALAGRGDRLALGRLGTHVFVYHTAGAPA